MQHGKIMEVGRHQGLMEKKGIYYQLVMAQLFEDTTSGYNSGEETPAVQDSGYNDREHPLHRKPENRHHIFMPKMVDRDSISHSLLYFSQFRFFEIQNTLFRKIRCPETLSFSSYLRKQSFSTEINVTLFSHLRRLCIGSQKSSSKKQTGQP